MKRFHDPKAVKRHSNLLQLYKKYYNSASGRQKNKKIHSKYIFIAHGIMFLSLIKNHESKNPKH